MTVIKYALVEDNNVVQIFDGLPQSYKNMTGFQHQIGNDDYLRTLGFYPVIEIAPDYDVKSQYLTGPTWVINETNAIATYGVASYSDLQLEEQRNYFMKVVREQRDNLLTKCDWTVLPDVVENKSSDWITQWKTYRQNLRNFPNSIVLDLTKPPPEFSSLNWPEIPNVTDE